MKTSAGRARFWLFGCAGLTLALSALPASAQSTDPIKIGVIGEESSVAGASLTKAAVMAADDINAHGGVNGRKIEVITYDNHSSASDCGARLPARGEPGQGSRGHRQLYQRSRPGARALVGAAAHAIHHAGRREQSDLQARPRRLRSLQIHVPRLAHVRLHRAGDLRLHARYAGRSVPS